MFVSDFWKYLSFLQLFQQSGGQRTARSETKPRGQGSHPQPDPSRGQGDLGALQPGKINPHSEGKVGEAAQNI